MVGVPTERAQPFSTINNEKQLIILSVVVASSPMMLIYFAGKLPNDWQYIQKIPNAYTH